MRMISFIILLIATSLGAMTMEKEMELWNAECYDENSKLQQTIAQNFLNLLQKQFTFSSPSPLFLDIGCGNGRITRSILDSFPGIQIVGVDSSPDMILFANTHFANTQVTFSEDLAEELKTIQSESMDAITSFSCLHWVHDQQSAFQKMHHVLKPGGWAGLLFAAETGFEDPIDLAFAQAISEDLWKEYFVKPTTQVDWNITKPKTIKNQLESLGFQVIFMDVQNFDYYFESPELFQSWILASAQQLKLLPTDLQKTCAKRIADLYLKATSHRQPLNHQCIYQVDAFMLVARKL